MFESVTLIFHYTQQGVGSRIYSILTKTLPGEVPPGGESHYICVSLSRNLFEWIRVVSFDIIINCRPKSRLFRFLFLMNLQKPETCYLKQFVKADNPSKLCSYLHVVLKL